MTETRFKREFGELHFKEENSMLNAYFTMPRKAAMELREYWNIEHEGQNLLLGSVRLSLVSDDPFCKAMFEQFICAAFVEKARELTGLDVQWDKPPSPSKNEIN